MDKNLKVQESSNGLGVFAVKTYKPEQLIVEITGNVINWKKLLNIGGIVLDNAYRYDKNNYLSPDGIANYFNHSCEPNAGVIKKGDKLYLKAVRIIKPENEITFDYSTITGNDDIWTMTCNCKTKSCRKEVKNFGSLPPEKKIIYITQGVVPDYILASK